MKIKAETGYQISFYTLLVLTVASYLWSLYSIVSWIIGLF